MFLKGQEAVQSSLNLQGGEGAYGETDLVGAFIVIILQGAPNSTMPSSKSTRLLVDQQVAPRDGLEASSLVSI